MHNEYIFDLIKDVVDMEIHAETKISRYAIEPPPSLAKKKKSTSNTHTRITPEL